MAGSFSKGRHFGSTVEVMMDGKKKIVTPEEYKNLKEERLKNKATKKVSDKPKEPAPVIPKKKAENE
jgi:hypothetical protein